MVEAMSQQKERRHVLVTGLSGTGKTTLYELFRNKNIPAADADQMLLKWGRKGDQIEKGASFGWLLKNRPNWDVKELKELLRDNDEIYVFGIALNMPKAAMKNFDQVIYLKAPSRLLKERLKIQRANPYGTTKAQRELVMFVKPALDFVASAAALVSKRLRLLDASVTPDRLFLEIINGNAKK